MVFPLIFRRGEPESIGNSWHYRLNHIVARQCRRYRQHNVNCHKLAVSQGETRRQSLDQKIKTDEDQQGNNGVVNQRNRRRQRTPIFEVVPHNEVGVDRNQQHTDNNSPQSYICTWCGWIIRCHLSMYSYPCIQAQKNRPIV